MKWNNLALASLPTTTTNYYAAKIKLIERIEVLRGPQSALYGSDAIGGVINIITRKGRGVPRASASIEAGSYGTKIAKGAISGGNQSYDYALSLTGAQGAGFSTYGARTRRISSLRPTPLENDSFSRIGGAAKFSWRPVEGVEIETGVTSNANNGQYDAAFGAFPDTPSRAESRMTTGYLRTIIDTFDGRLRNSLTISGNQTNRSYNDVSFSNFGPALTREWNKYTYVGQRGGFEYQGDLKLDAYGKLIFGAKWEEEKLSSQTRPLESAFNKYSRTPANQVTKSLFALYQLPIGERLDLSIGGRIDDVENADRFNTWRITGAYRIDELGLKLRASAGTGGKAPSLFQLKSPQYGTPSLQAEKSFGVDAGFDQSLLGGRLLLSATLFHNELNNLIDFSPFSLSTFSYPVCPLAQRFSGCYLNVAKAETSGVELSADAKLIEGFLSVKAVYTHMVSLDKATGKHLPRRPEDEGRISFRITPLDKLTIELSVFIVGKRWSSANETLRLAPYARFDMRADYQVNNNLNLFARAENLTGAKYQEIYNYGTTGRAFYLGAKATW